MAYESNKDYSLHLLVYTITFLHSAFPWVLPMYVKQLPIIIITSSLIA